MHNRILLLTVATSALMLIAEKCPTIDCEDEDGVLQSKGACFIAKMTDKGGKIDKFIIGTCPNDNP